MQTPPLSNNRKNIKEMDAADPPASKHGGLKESRAEGGRGNNPFIHITTRKLHSTTEERK